jgi:hypothetical protein
MTRARRCRGRRGRRVRAAIPARRGRRRPAPSARTGRRRTPARTRPPRPPPSHAAGRPVAPATRPPAAAAANPGNGCARHRRTPPQSSPARRLTPRRSPATTDLTIRVLPILGGDPAVERKPDTGSYDRSGQTAAGVPTVIPPDVPAEYVRSRPVGRGTLTGRRRGRPRRHAPIITLTQILRQCPRRVGYSALRRRCAAALGRVHRRLGVLHPIWVIRPSFVDMRIGCAWRRSVSGRRTRLG